MTDYQQFIDRGLTTEVIPIVPSLAKSTDRIHSLGKQPSMYNHVDGAWTPLHQWQSNTTTIGDITGWQKWPEHNIGLRTRNHPSIDVDIDEPMLAQWVNDIVTHTIGNTATRSRVNSARTVRITRLADGEPLQAKRKIILENGAIELLGDGQQVVVSGLHPSGYEQHTSGEILTVTVAQLDTLWQTLINGLGDQVKKLTGGGDASTADNGALVVHTDDSIGNIAAVMQFIKDQPAPLEGERNDSCYKLAARIREHHALSQTMCLNVLEGYAGLPGGEIKAVVASVYRGNTQSAQGEKHPAAVGFGVTELPAGASLDPPGASPPGEYYETNQPLTTYEFNPLHCNAKMVPRGTIENFKRMLDLYNVNVAYDQVAKDILISGGMTHGNDGSDNANYAKIYSLCSLNQFPHGFIDHGLSYLAEHNQFNPVMEWINSKPWDGKPRIKQLFETLTLANDEDRGTAYMLFRKWLIGAVKIVQEKITRMEYVLVLQSEAGGEGKTAWFKSLCPQPWRADGVILDTADKDSVKKVISHWIVELGELDSTFRKSDVKRLMAFLSNDRDEIRLPYAKCANRFARRTAMGASVNGMNFLQDDSGDRRFWPISVKSVNYNHDIDMQQLWAQVDTLDDPHWLDDKENKTVIEYNKDFKAVDNIVETLDMHFSQQATGDIHLTATEVCHRAGLTQINKLIVNKAAKYLRDAGYKSTKVRGKRGFRVPNVNAFTKT